MFTDLKIALRKFYRSKVLYLISILGLGIGLGCVILLLALIIHEKSSDKFIPDYKNVYRVNDGESCITQYPLAVQMKEDIPEVKDYFRFYQKADIDVKIPGKEVVTDHYLGFADPSIFGILGIKFIVGEPASSANEITVSESTAHKYFGKSSPLGEVLQIKLNGKFQDLTITGVYNNFPRNSTLFPNFIAETKLSEDVNRQVQRSLGEYGYEDLDKVDWKSFTNMTYVVLDKNADKASISARMSKYLALAGFEKMKERKYALQPVSEIYMGSEKLDAEGICRKGNADELKYYAAISFIILLIAVVNYIFLTRATTTDRLRELGTKKVLGAYAVTLRKQILFESLLVAIISLIPAMIVISFGIPFIDNVLGKTLSAGIFSKPLLWLVLLMAVLFTGTISGLFIGYKISKLSPLLLLKTMTSEKGSGRGKWNYSFLVLHFSIYIILVSSVIAVSKQISYALTNFKGIEPKNVIFAELNSDELMASFTSLCDEMNKTPGVIMSAGTSFIPPFNQFIPLSLAVYGSDERIRCDGLIMGEKMTELLGINVIDGASFGTFRPSSNEVIINESTAKKYNVKAGDKFLDVFTIRGVVKDFNAHSLHRLIQPMLIMQQNPQKMGILAAKTDGQNDKAVIKHMHDLFKQISPNEVFQVKYLTDQIGEFYQAETNQGKIISAFSLLATILSVMGLFGIALVTISRRTKEIGVRKVNGASVKEILGLLNSDVIRWILLSILIAVPGAIYIITSWLKRFAYKTTLDWWIFAGAAVSAVVIAVLTISWQSWRAATRNPVEALRYE